MDINDYLPSQEVMVGSVIYGAAGTLLGKAVCKLSWKEAGLWAVGSAIFNYSIGHYFNDISKGIDSWANKNISFLSGRESKGNRDDFSFVATFVLMCLSNYVANKAASYLMKVPSTLFVLGSFPVLFVGSAVLSRELRRY